MQNKALYPSAFDYNRLIAAVLTADLNDSSPIQFNYKMNPDGFNPFLDYCEWFEKHLQSTVPEGCKCVVFPLVQGDSTKIVSETPCDWIKHFNVINESGTLYIQKTEGVRVLEESVRNDILSLTPDACSIGIGQILKHQGTTDNNLGLAFNYSKEMLEMLKQWRSMNIRLDKYLHITSIFPPVDFLLNASCALAAKMGCLGLSQCIVAEMQEVWLKIVNDIFRASKVRCNWVEYTNNVGAISVFSFANESEFVSRCSQLSSQILDCIESVLVSGKVSVEVSFALQQIKEAVCHCVHRQLTNILYVSKLPQGNRADDGAPNEKSICDALKEEARLREVQLFLYEDVKRQRNIIMRFLAVAS